MNWSRKLRIIIQTNLYFCLLFAQNGILNVGFDIDDTILFSRDVFLNLPEDKRNPTDYGWINAHDEDYSCDTMDTNDFTGIKVEHYGCQRCSFMSKNRDVLRQCFYLKIKDHCCERCEL